MAEQTQLQVQDPLSCSPQMPQAEPLSLRARRPLPLWCLHDLRMLQLYPLRGPKQLSNTEQPGAEAALSLPTSSQGLVDNSGWGPCTDLAPQRAMLESGVGWQ